MSEKYNGYTNYETWLVALWIDNDQYRQGEAHTIACTETDIGVLAENIKQWVYEWDEINTGVESGTIVADLINSALSEVDWYELAGMYRQEVKEDEEGDEE